MTLKGDSTTKEKLTCSFKYDMSFMNFMNFHPTTLKSKTFTSIFLSKVYKVWAKKKYREGLSFMTLSTDAKFELSLTLWFQNWHEELGETSLEYSKSERMYMNGLFLSKAYNVLARKFQRNYVSWHWKVMQNVKEN